MFSFTTEVHISYIGRASVTWYIKSIKSVNQAYLCLQSEYKSKNCHKTILGTTLGYFLWKELFVNHNVNILANKNAWNFKFANI